MLEGSPEARACAAQPWLRGSTAEQGHELRIVVVVHRAFHGTARLAARIDDEVERELGIGRHAEVAQPLLALLALLEPVRAFDAAARLGLEETLELALIVVERHEHQPERLAL